MSYNEMVQELSKTESNNKCFDCDSPNPHWASISLGTFICLECASLHRGYGVKVSKVRSINMDNWTEPMYKIMKDGGNKNLHEYIKLNYIHNIEKEELYKHESIRKYVNKLCGNNENINKAEETIRNRVENQSYGYDSYSRNDEYTSKSNETYQESITNTLWKVGEFIANKTSHLKDKSFETGEKFYQNVLTPTTKILKKKATELKDKFVKKENKYVKKQSSPQNINDKKTDNSKWD